VGHNRQRAKDQSAVRGTEDARYLAVTPEPLASIATILIDSGLRPEECFRLRWENVRLLSGQNGALLITHGKKAAARRVVLMTPRVRAIFEARRDTAGKPGEDSVFPRSESALRPRDCEDGLRTKLEDDKGQRSEAFLPVLVATHISDAAGRIRL